MGQLSRPPLHRRDHARLSYVHDLMIPIAAPTNGVSVAMAAGQIARQTTDFVGAVSGRTVRI